jgi:hypothetical protein
MEQVVTTLIFWKKENGYLIKSLSKKWKNVLENWKMSFSL